MEPERIIPRIFYTQYTHCWSTERLRVQGFTHIVRIDHQNQPPPIDVNANEEALEPGCQLAGLEMVDLDFNNSSPYATMVLPSCYKSVKFIERAMRGSGSILVVGGAKDYGLAIVIVVGYLMYKDHLRFRTVYHQLKLLHPHLELDPYYQSQLREYEPILQATRSQLYRAGCSREVRTNDYLKRKFTASHHHHHHNHHDECCTNTIFMCDDAVVFPSTEASPLLTTLDQRPINTTDLSTILDTAMVE